MKTAGRSVVLCGILLGSLAPFLAAADTPPKKQFTVGGWLFNVNVGRQLTPPLVIDEGGSATAMIGDNADRTLEVTAHKGVAEKPNLQRFDFTLTDASNPGKPVVIRHEVSLGSENRGQSHVGFATGNTWKYSYLFGVTVERRTPTDPVDKSVPAFDDPDFQQWMKDVAAKPADKQAEAVVKKLQDLNSGYPEPGAWLSKIENGVVTEFRITTDNITNISPVRALPGLKVLTCGGSRSGKGGLSDLSPLRGMPLTKLICNSAKVADLSPLSHSDRKPGTGKVPSEGLPELTNLALGETAVTDADLAHLQGLTHLTLLSLRNTRISDAGVQHLTRLSRLAVLDLDGTRVTDAGLERLHELPRLMNLQLRSTNVTDAGLAHIQGMTSIKMLTLDETKITDGGLVHLQGLNDLVSLRLERTQVTDAGLSHLKPLNQLRYLSLNGTWTTDAGLAHLQGFAQLRMLSLNTTGVTDAGLSRLQGLGQLEFLDLGSTAVTDAGLAHLEGLTHLKTLMLYKSQATEDGVAKFKAAVPMCHVMR